MGKIQEAQKILKQLGLPPAQYNEMAALTLLALCNIKEADDWSNATKQSLGISNGIMTFINVHYNKHYAPNTRETFRRQVLHQFVQARIVDYNPDNPNLPVNSPKAHYAITEELVSVVRYYKADNWDAVVEVFSKSFEKLKERYVRDREFLQIPLKLSNNKIVKLSPGKHNQLQVAIVNEFAPRFINNGILLYLGDTANKNLFSDSDLLEELHIPIDAHSKLPDVVIYDKQRSWLFLMEAVTSHGPVSPKRIIEIEEFLKDCTLGKVYVSAFPNIAEFKKHINDIAWETEVWLMDMPDHMIHFNGDRFLGPR